MTSKTHYKACQHVAIAQSKVGEVMICPDCGVVHLALQALTMRFDFDAFSELARMLGQAHHAIENAHAMAEIKYAEAVTQASATTPGTEHRHLEKPDTTPFFHTPQKVH